jgi:hypothetical protein
VPLDEGLQIEHQQLSVLNDDPAVDDRQIDALGVAEDQWSQWIVERASVVKSVKSQSNEVGRLPR